ncbi:alpha/beta fold hydrolase [Gimesia chilikensis]|uniref:2-hydroxymuconate semialdehyde hydrolase n=1 Tax=Gimesia chilikensis TaxID=2605989 RepID=A0A517PYM8_9PLAN|nr:alpha/beta hydrolase [Gimesia chilikensis]QDT24475.1 2-hydroxymuconate semialdehyde hydrolase [Gimesia chilikensis]
MKKTLILLPGLGSTEVTWQHQLEHLGDTLEVQSITMDQAQNRSELVETFLNQAPDQFYLAGHSFGGWLAQAVAAAAPKRVLKLMLCNTFTRHNPDHIGLLALFQENIQRGLLDESLDANLKDIIHPDRLEDEQLVVPLQAMLKGFSPDGYQNQVQAMIDDYATEPLLPDITCPTLVTAARQDLVFPLQELQYLADQLTDARFTIVEDSGHMSPMERPQAITALMRLWFAA